MVIPALMPTVNFIELIGLAIDIEPETVEWKLAGDLFAVLDSLSSDERKIRNHASYGQTAYQQCSNNVWCCNVRTQIILSNGLQ